MSDRFCVSALFRSGFLPNVWFRFRLCLEQDSILVARVDIVALHASQRGIVAVR